MLPAHRTALIQEEEEVVEAKSLYAFDKIREIWIPVQETAPQEPFTLTPKSFSLITYNIDAMNYFVNQRLHTIFSFLNTHTVAPLLDASPPVPTIILVQELRDTAIPTLLAHPVVRAQYCVTDVTAADWTAHYGTLTLVPRALALAGRVRAVFRTPFESSGMGRSALYVDIGIEEKKVLRIANVHLESLRGRADTLRIEQLESVARRLHAPDVHAGVVAGDMNPIGPHDDAAPARFGLSDAWLICQAKNVAGEYEGKPKSEKEWEGHTWGHQPPSQFPERRMDKILLTGPLEPKRVEVIGMGLMAEGVGHDEDLEDLDEEPMWVSDHYGLVARIDIV